MIQTTMVALSHPEAALWPAPSAASGASARSAPATVGNRDLAYLSKSDFELVYQATGQRIDASSEIVPLFAIQLAMDRQSGGLPPQGPVPASYLSGLLSRYSDAPWMVEQASRALAWVEQRGGTSGVDLQA